jgi:hypothetical protein
MAEVLVPTNNHQRRELLRVLTIEGPPNRLGMPLSPLNRLSRQEGAMLLLGVMVVVPLEVMVVVPLEVMAAGQEETVS